MLKPKAAGTDHFLAQFSQYYLIKIMNVVSLAYLIYAISHLLKLFS